MLAPTGDFPRVSVQDVKNCSFPVWYPIFEKQTLRSVILPLTDDFLEYLRSDEFFLPTSANKVMDNMRQSDTQSSSDEEDHWSDEDADDDASKKISFPELEKQIQDVLDDYESVFPKLNWSSPKDARWMVTDSRLKCTNLADIFLLLKSSDFITHDLTEPFKFCHDEKQELLSTIQYTLVLRKWSALQPAKEFRCFVKNNRVIAISQRDCENYYDFITPSADLIVTNLLEFFHTHIGNRFLSSDFIVDIYRKDANKLYIIDFNPWGPMTDGLLFNWHELFTLSSQEATEMPEFRFVTSQNGIKASSYTQYAIPKDIADISRECDVNKLADVLSTRIQMENKDSDSEHEANT